MNDASIAAAVAAAPAIDLLMPAVGYISELQPISGGLPAAPLHLAATAEYDLRPLNDEPATDDQADDLLVDILSEAVLKGSYGLLAAGY